jgi:hypothetical protein
MDAPHTPGPWAYRAMAGYCTQIDGADGHTICCFDEDPGDADAKLITAAPELLEALQSALKQAEFEEHAERPWHEKARAAIARATGR